MGRPTLFTNRKYLRLISILQIPEPHVLGLLEYIWRSAYESGQDVLGDSVDVELAAKWNGEAGVLTQTLTDVGFIDEEDGIYIIHDLYDHAPAYVQKRMEREAERIQHGTTISELRKEAGRKGGLTTQDKIRQRKSKASGNQLLDLVKQTEANGHTPTPTPTPTQKKSLSPPDPISEEEKEFVDKFNEYVIECEGRSMLNMKKQYPAVGVILRNRKYRGKSVTLDQLYECLEKIKTGWWYGRILSIESLGSKTQKQDKYKIECILSEQYPAQYQSQQSDIPHPHQIES